MLKNFVHSVFLITITFIISSYSTDPKSYVSENDFKTYIESTRNKINFTVNKCEDFINFSCSKETQPSFQNLIFDQIIDGRTNEEEKLFYIIKSLYIDQEPRDDTERKVRDMYLSQKKSFHNETITAKEIAAVLEQIDNIEFKTTTSDVTASDITDIFKKIMLSGFSYIGPIGFGTTYTETEEPALSFYVNIDSVNYMEPITNKTIEIMQAANLKDEIIEFMESYQNVFTSVSKRVLYDHKRKIFDSIDDLTKELPTTTFNWNEIIPKLQQNPQIKDRKIVVQNIDLIKTLLQLFDSTKKSTIYNFYLTNFIRGITKKNPFHIRYLYDVTIGTRYWNEIFTNDFSNMRMLNFLDDIQTIVSNMSYSNENYKEHDKKFQNFLTVLNSAIKNHQFLFSYELRDRYFNHLEIDPNKFYLNSYNLGILCKEMRDKYPEENIIPGSNGTFDMEVSRIITLPFVTNFKHKPYIYMFYGVNYWLWEHFFKGIFRYRKSENFELYKQLVLKELENEVYTEEERNLTSETILDKRFIEEYATYRKISSIFMNFSNNPEHGLNKELKIFSKMDSKFHDLSLSNYGWIGLFQFNCEIGKENETKTWEKFLKMIGAFHVEFNCPETPEFSIFKKLMKNKEIQKSFLSVITNPFQFDSNESQEIDLH